MNSQTLLKELGKKENNTDLIAEALRQNPELITCVIAGLSSAGAALKFKYARILRLINQTDPTALYPCFEVFENLLDHENSILKWNVIDIIADLATVDVEKRFDPIFDKFYSLLWEANLITAAHVVENSGKIAAAKPYLEERIAAEILKVAEIPLPTQECSEIIAGKAIIAFIQYPRLANNRKAVVSFVAGQANSTRNATRKRAEAFLIRHGMKQSATPKDK